MLLSQKQDPSRNESYNSDQEVQVCGIFLVDSGWTPLYDLSLSLYIFFLDMGYIFFLLFFFLTCLVDMWHTFFGYASFLFSWHSFFFMPFGHAAYLHWVCIFYLFFIAHILDGNLGERVMIELGVLFCGWMTVFAMWVDVYVILIMRVWQVSNKGKRIWPNSKQSQTAYEGFSMNIYVWLW